MGKNTEDERFDEVLRGPTNLSGAINTAEYVAQFNIQPDDNFGPRGYDVRNIWYEENGATLQSLKPRATIAELTTDGAQTDSRVAIESPAVVYRPGTELSTSLGLFVDVLPTGDSVYKIHYGREPRTIVDPYDGTEVGVGKEYAGLEIVNDPDSDRDHDLEWVVGTDVDDDGVAEENRVKITAGDWGEQEFIKSFDTDPKAEVYGIDPLNGDGASNIRFDATDGYVYGIEVGWYAPTALVPYIVETANINGVFKQRKHPILIYNPKGGPSIRRPNQPIRLVADNGTSGDDLQARLGGRFGGYRGRIDSTPVPDTHKQYNQDVPTSGGVTGTNGQDWFVVGVVKSRAIDPDAIIAPNPATYAANNRGATQVRLIEESDITGTIEYDEPSNTARNDVTFAIDAKEDTPDRLSVDTATIDGETKFVGQKVGGDILSSAGNNQVALSVGDRDFQFAIPRDYVLVYMAAAITNNAVELDSVYDFVTIG